MAEETTRRKSKDSVFVDIFKNVEYVLQLYRELHPEDTSVTAEDISIKTIRSVLVNTLYNDLGFVVRDTYIMLVEAQSIWNPNISLRLMFYLFESYRRYLEETTQSEHSSSRVKIPRPELYVIYSGTKPIGNEISFSEDFFGGCADVDARIRVIKEVDTTLCGQYIGFCRVYDEQKKLYNNKLQCAKETVRISMEQGYLKNYLAEHEKETVTMMEELFDEEYLRERYNKAENQKSLQKGMEIGVEIGLEKGIEKGIEKGMKQGEQKGMISVLFSLVKDGVLTLKDAAARAGMSIAEFESRTAALQ